MSESEPRWEISLTRQAEKTLHRLSKNLLQRLDQVILALAANPRPPNCQRLPGHDNLFRLYVDEWRIAYAIEEERLVVLILEIAPKQQPERYQLEEIGEPPSATQGKEWIENASLAEDFYKALMAQPVEDFIYYRTLGAKPYDEPKRIDILRDANQEKIRVLIVDDMAETRENLRKLLYLESDIEIVGAATNGEEAIQMAVEQQPDVVLMDIIMPGINGFTATEIISQRVPSAQIIMMSVQGDADTFRQAMLAGAKEFLIKPFSSDELMSSVRRVYQSTTFQKLPATLAAPHSRDVFKDLKIRIQAKLLAELDPTLDISRPDEVRQAIQDMFERILTQENIILSRSERERLFESIVAEMLGYADQATKIGQASFSHLRQIYQAGMKLKQLTEVLVGEEAELDETQKRTLAQWFKFYKLGNNIEISLSVADLSTALSFYKKLGLGRVDGGEKPYPWAVISDGRLHLGLHQQVFSSPTLGYFGLSILEERKVHLTKLGIKLDHIQMSWLNFVTAEFASPEGQRVLLADLRSDVETTPSGRKFFPKCQSFGELSLKTEDVNATVTYWERLGFERVAEGDQPYPWAIVSDGRIQLGFHQTPKLTQPTITYFAPDMPDRLKRLRRRGIKFVAEHKDRKRRRVGAVIESPDGQLFFLFTGEIKPQMNGSRQEVGIDEENRPRPEDAQWYKIYTYAGSEGQVRQNLLHRIEAMGMQDKIFRVVLPNKKSEVTLLPGGQHLAGYILVEMIVDENSWYVVKNTPGVTGFFGSGDKLMPLSPAEVDQFLKRADTEAPQIKVNFKVGQKVRIIEGPFADFVGTVDEVNLDQAQIRVRINFFGQEMPVELDFSQVERA